MNEWTAEWRKYGTFFSVVFIFIYSLLSSFFPMGEWVAETPPKRIIQHKSVIFWFESTRANILTVQAIEIRRWTRHKRTGMSRTRGEREKNTLKTLKLLWTSNSEDIPIFKHTKVMYETIARIRPNSLKNTIFFLLPFLLILRSFSIWTVRGACVFFPSLCTMYTSNFGGKCTHNREFSFPRLFIVEFFFCSCSSFC